MNTEEQVEQPAPNPPPGAISKGKDMESPWKILLYGTPGVGKSTLATYAPKPFFLDLENGLKYIDCEKTETVLQSFDEVAAWLQWALTSEYQTIVIDTVDELEALMATKLCADNNKDNLDSFGYGKGQNMLALEWRKFIGNLGYFTAAGKNVLLVAHEKIEKVEDPTSENYDRFQLNIHKKTAPIVTAKMDAVLFARGEVLIHDKSNDTKRATGTGNRVIHCLGAPCWVAKNRFGLPEQMEMNPNIFNLISGKEEK
jgi:Cdc6-like AAA superfamily ATPase